MFERFYIYFYALLMVMGYDYLVYELDPYYIPALVHEFYDGLTKSDILRDSTSFTLK